MDFPGKNKTEVLVISDLHLGTMASNATVLLEYLKNINPGILVLNGDIIDAWRFSRNYFPKSHLRVIRHFIKLMEKGTKVYYITGNHDEIFRKFAHTRFGKLKIVNQLTLKLNGEKTWFLHGDIFDPAIRKMKWISKAGAALYGFISLINWVLKQFFKQSTGKRLLLYKAKKPGFDSEYILGFEKRAAREAIKRGVQTAICGHTHVPADKKIDLEVGSVRYLNSGDWVENNSALEYNDGQWKLVFSQPKQVDGTKYAGDISLPTPELTFAVGLN